MPIYDFLNIETDEIIEKRMTIAEKEQYLLDNPHIHSYFGKEYANISLIDPVRLGITRPSNGFTDRLKETIKGLLGHKLIRMREFECTNYLRNLMTILSAFIKIW